MSVALASRRLALALSAPLLFLAGCIDHHEPGGPIVCPATYEPVCGVDGRTYGNSCQADAAGVAIAHTGACTIVTEGCYTNGDCRMGEHCVLPVDASGGGTDASGAPKREEADFAPPRPRGMCVADEPSCTCDEIYAPVCGTDNVTYSNACFAACHHVDVARTGECGCRTNADCGEGKHCEIVTAVDIREPAPGSDADPAPGVPAPPPESGVCVDDRPVCSCFTVYAPVCGVDGLTYGNSCEAACAGVAVAHDGACMTSACATTADCDSGYTCAVECTACAAERPAPPPDDGGGDMFAPPCETVCAGRCVPATDDTTPVPLPMR